MNKQEIIELAKQIKQVQIGESFNADFEENLWAFQFDADFEVTAGRYAIVPINLFNEIIVAIQSLTTEPQVDKVTAEEIENFIEETAEREVNNCDRNKENNSFIHESEVYDAIISAMTLMQTYATQSNAEGMREHAIGFKREDIIDAYVQGSLKENPLAREREVNAMIENANAYFDIHFSNLTTLTK